MHAEWRTARIFRLVEIDLMASTYVGKYFVMDDQFSVGIEYTNLLSK